MTSGALRARVAGSRVLFVVWVLVVTVIVVTVAFRATTPVGPGEIQMRIRPSLQGGSELAVPPLGAIRATTHAAPVQLRFELREIDLLDALGPRGVAAGSPTTTDLGADALAAIEQEVDADIGSALRTFAVRLGLSAALAGGVAALMFPGRRTWRRIAVGTLLGPIAVAVVVGPAVAGFDPERFEQDPEFVGPLAAAPDLLQQVGSLETRFGSVQSRTQVLAERITALYSTVTTGEIRRSDGEVVLLHVSDLHLNAVGLSLAQELARSFDVDAVIDTGDITSFGFAPEAGFAELLEGFDTPYYLVAGNHDSEAVRRRFAASDDVHLLDGDVVDIDGVRVLGISDPTVTALRTIPAETIERTYRDQFPSTRRLVRTEDPDLVMVHNPLQAEPVLGEARVVAAGHLHRTRLEVIDGTVLTVAGSSGATGLGDLLVDEASPYRFQLLRFVEGRLVAVDQIELDGAAGDFQLQRHLIRVGEGDTLDELPDDEVDERPRDQVDDEVIARITSTTGTSTNEADRPDSGG